MVFTEEEVQQVHNKCAELINSFRRQSKGHLPLLQLIEYQTLDTFYGVVMLTVEEKEENMEKLSNLVGRLTLEQNELQPSERKMYRIVKVLFIEID
jgi:hypothetical protein